MPAVEQKERHLSLEPNSARVGIRSLEALHVDDSEWRGAPNRLTKHSFFVASQCIAWSLALNPISGPGALRAIGESLGLSRPFRLDRCGGRRAIGFRMQAVCDTLT